MTRLTFVLMALALAVPARPASDGDPAGKDPFKMASIEEVAKQLGQSRVAVFDANPRKVFEENRLPGAVFVTGKKGEELAKLLPAEKQTRLIFYCYNPK